MANSPFYPWSNGWTPVSFDNDTTAPTYDWDVAHTLGFRLDSADGTFASVSYYLDDAYMGSWLYQTSATSLSMSVRAPVANRRLPDVLGSDGCRRASVGV